MDRTLFGAQTKGGKPSTSNTLTSESILEPPKRVELLTYSLRVNCSTN